MKIVLKFCGIYGGHCFELLTKSASMAQDFLNVHQYVKYSNAFLFNYYNYYQSFDIK